MMTQNHADMLKTVANNHGETMAMLDHLAHKHERTRVFKAPSPQHPGSQTPTETWKDTGDSSANADAVGYPDAQRGKRQCHDCREAGQAFPEVDRIHGAHRGTFKQEETKLIERPPALAHTVYMSCFFLGVCLQCALCANGSSDCFSEGRE